MIDCYEVVLTVPVADSGCTVLAIATPYLVISSGRQTSTSLLRMSDAVPRGP